VEEGEIIRVPLPESDGKTRSRPALIIKKVPPYNDFLVCAISGKVHNEVPGLDIVIDSNHHDFSLSGLKYPSLIRVSFLYTFSAQHIEGVIGKISKETLGLAKENIKKFL
jgi:mRNA interferase MazF